MKCRYTIQCVDPETGKTGCWIFVGDDHRKKGTRITEVFSDLKGLFEHMDKTGWHTSQVPPLSCEHPELDNGVEYCNRRYKETGQKYKVLYPSFLCMMVRGNESFNDTHRTIYTT